MALAWSKAQGAGCEVCHRFELQQNATLACLQAGWLLRELSRCCMHLLGCNSVTVGPWKVQYSPAGPHSLHMRSQVGATRPDSAAAGCAHLSAQIAAHPCQKHLQVVHKHGCMLCKVKPSTSQSYKALLSACAPPFEWPRQLQATANQTKYRCCACEPDAVGLLSGCITRPRESCMDHDIMIHLIFFIV